MPPTEFPHRPARGNHSTPHTPGNGAAPADAALAATDGGMSGQEFRILVETAPDIIARFDRDRRHLYVNPAIERATGLTAEAFLGRTHDEVAAELGLGEPFARRWREALGRVLSSGQETTVRFDFPTDAGTRWFECRVSPVFDADGAVAGMLSVGRDITALHEARRELAAREAYYRSLIDNTSDLLTVVDADGVIRDQNDAAETLLGYPREEALGRPVFDFVHPEDAGRVAAELARFLARGEVTPLLGFRLRCRTGGWREFESKARRLDGAGGDALVLVNSRDVTARRREERAMQRRERILEAVGRTASRMLDDEDWRAQLPRLIEALGLASGADRVWLFENDSLEPAAPRFSFRSSWAAPGIPPRAGAEHLRRVDPKEAGLSKGHEVLSRGEVLHGPTREMPAAESEMLAAFGILSLAAVPVFVGGAWWGTLSFHACTEEREWTAVELDALRTAAQLVGAAIHRQQVLDQRRSTELRFRTLFEQAADGIAICDAEGRFVEVNERLCAMLGLARGALLEMRLADVVVEASGPRLDEVWHRIAQGHVVTGDARLRCSEGGALPVELRNSAIEFDGRALVLSMIRDVSGQKQVEQELRDSEAWYRSLTQNALDIVTVLSPRGEIRYCSPSAGRLLGYDEVELIGRSIFALLHPEDAARVRERLQQMWVADERGFTVEVRIRASDGSWQVHEAVGTALLDDPAVQGIVLNSRDVTERRRLEEQLRQAQKMEAVGKLAGGIAHDFNNLLTAITGHAQFLLERIEPGSTLREDVEEIDRSASRAADLTRQLLAFSRKQMLQPRVVDLNALIGGMSRLLRRIIGEDVELVTDLLPCTGTVRVDPGQFEQVLLNLAVNARDAMPQGGRLVLRTRTLVVEYPQRRGSQVIPPNRYVLVSVQDNGVGMDEAVRSNAFEPFFTTKEIGQGTGLGLATVYGIVSQSGGFIEVDSAPGRGTVFSIYLPESGAPADAAPGAAALPEPATEAGGASILLVEDEPSVRRLTRKVLERQGYRVIEAATPADAIRLEAAEPGIDLLLTDVVMPGMSGQELADALRERRPGLGILFMSGYNEEAIVQQGVLRAGTTLLAKPFSPAELLTRVRRALDGGEP